MAAAVPSYVKLVVLLLAIALRHAVAKHYDVNKDCRQTGFALETVIPQRAPTMSEENCKDLCSRRHLDLVIWLNVAWSDRMTPSIWNDGKNHTWLECKQSSGVCQLDNWARLEDRQDRPGVKQCRCTAIVEFKRWGPRGDESNDWCYPDNAMNNLAQNAVVHGVWTDFDTTWVRAQVSGNSWYWFRNEHIDCDASAGDTGCDFVGHCWDNGPSPILPTFEAQLGNTILSWADPEARTWILCPNLGRWATPGK
ncbi:hypothetical protein BCR37DRAFT_388569 [Protomyces lactucae-debilis]|uniref:Uncharacterized protein n=1 Tax=Protomyces lactucae-debilis TaxID=2754530 RepID=A0A1Y2F4V0_PROLT|nr:uncharacterized protein BCR37DRAFT_388569 [Protomyces lactucae-debilis]ORY78940.1 hypothetical protein BCR37DRAFT_388569 [Protomyces lactucae-debilis]